LPALGVKTLSNHLLAACCSKNIQNATKGTISHQVLCIIDSAKVLKAGKVKANYTVDKS